MLDKKVMYAIGQVAARTARMQAPDSDANEVIDFVPLLKPWKEGVQLAGEIVIDSGVPYRTITSHDSAGNPEWRPENTPSLFAPYHGTDRAHALPWRAPTGTHDAYQKGEWMIWTDGKKYECAEDNTVWDPQIMPTAWIVGNDTP
ncbi:MAG: hypothetical protein E7321_10325 [Clostridiales bacterium]|nr:hypothetical protein [Clostridiales bacterium]